MTNQWVCSNEGIVILKVNLKLIVVSSAYIRHENFMLEFTKSFIKMLKNNRPNIDR